jgi:hypothetical protein
MRLSSHFILAGHATISMRIMPLPSRRERKKPATVFERISKLLHASDRGHKLSLPPRRRPLIALQALQLPESAEGSLHLPGALGAQRG